MKVVLKHILVFMSWTVFTVFIDCQREPFIVGGKKARIERFPHSVFLGKICYENDQSIGQASRCGASIVNELIILTSAICVEECPFKIALTAYMGHVGVEKGYKSTVQASLMHPKFETVISYDIALAKLTTPIKFCKLIKRLAFMAEPPYSEKARVAGWGMINEDKQTRGKYLKFVDQWVGNYSYCSRIADIARGTICVSSKNPNEYASWGDTGSALVVRGYIQIGIASYKMPMPVPKSLVIYTDTGYFYKWIVKNAKKLYCSRT